MFKTKNLFGVPPKITLFWYYCLVYTVCYLLKNKWRLRNAKQSNKFATESTSIKEVVIEAIFTCDNLLNFKHHYIFGVPSKIFQFLAFLLRFCTQHAFLKCLCQLRNILKAKKSKLLVQLVTLSFEHVLRDIEKNLVLNIFFVTYFGMISPVSCLPLAGEPEISWSDSMLHVPCWQKSLFVLGSEGEETSA
jgi:hypothetical protein